MLYDTAPRGEAGPVCEGVSGEGVWEGGVDMYETEPVPKNEYLTELERGDSEVCVCVCVCVCVSVCVSVCVCVLYIQVSI